jgi:hypothetical protein
LALGIDEISHGRFSVNLISGWYMPEMEQAGLTIRAHDDRYRFPREWLRIVKALWRDENVSLDGDYFRIKELHFHPGLTLYSANVRETKMSTLASSGLSNLLIRPVAGRIGAEVGGLRLSGDLDQAIVDAIRQSLYRFKVLFFRGQEHLDELGQEAFGRLFGELVSHPTLPSHQGTQHVLDVDGAEIDQYLSLDGMLAHMSGGIGIDLGDVAWDEPIGDVQVERR